MFPSKSWGTKLDEEPDGKWGQGELKTLKARPIRRQRMRASSSQKTANTLPLPPGTRWSPNHFTPVATEAAR